MKNSFVVFFLGWFFLVSCGNQQGFSDIRLWEVADLPECPTYLLDEVEVAPKNDPCWMVEVPEGYFPPALDGSVVEAQFIPPQQGLPPLILISQGASRGFFVHELVHLAQWMEIKEDLYPHRDRVEREAWLSQAHFLVSTLSEEERASVLSGSGTSEKGCVRDKLSGLTECLVVRALLSNNRELFELAIAHYHLE